MQTDALFRRIFLKDERLRPFFRTLLYIVATVFCAASLVELATVVMGTASPAPLADKEPAYSFLLISEICLCTAVVGVAVLFRLFLDRRSIASLGLGFGGRWGRLLLIGALFGAGMQCLVFAIDELLGYAHVTAFATAGVDLMLIAKFVPLFALVAVAEEMSTRGYILQNLWEEWGVITAVILSSALFAVIHLGNPNSHANLALTLGGLLAYALWACLSLLWTRSLWLAVGVHMSWNLFEGPILGFPVSGLTFDATAVHQTIAGPDWFTGGPFGPESGAGSLVALAVGLALLYWLYRRGIFAGAPNGRESYAMAANRTR